MNWGRGMNEGGRLRAGAQIAPCSADLPRAYSQLRCSHPPLSPPFLHPLIRHSCTPLSAIPAQAGTCATTHRRATPSPRHPCAPFRHSCAPFPSFLRPLSVIPAQAGTRTPPPHFPNAPTNSPKKIHPSPLLGGRLGGGWEAPSVHQPSSVTPPPPHCHPTPLPAVPACAGMTGEGAHRSYAPPATPAPPSRHSWPPSPSFLRRQEPAHPLTPLPQRTKQLPQENSSLPPFRGEARWGVGSTERLPAVFRHRSPPFLPTQE